MLWANVEKPIFYRESVSHAPEDFTKQLRIAQMLFLHNQFKQAVILLDKLICLFPLEPAPYFILANTYIRIGNIESARKMFNRAPPILDNNAKMKLFRYELLMLLEQDIEQIALDTLALDPTNEVALTKLGHVFRKNNRLDCMIPLCLAALKHMPSHATARYLLAVAYAILGLPSDAMQIMNLEQFISITNIPQADGYAALIDEIIANNTLKPDPMYKATINGLQTDNIISNGTDHPMGALLQSLRLAVSDIVKNLPDEVIPKCVQLNAWAVVYPGNGRQRAHYHPGAWLSGVYYVNVPKNISEDPYRGNLVIGALEQDDFTVEPPWGVRYIQPSAGKLVLFPAYFPHATIPTQSNENRICVAFNVVPVNQ